MLSCRLLLSSSISLVHIKTHMHAPPPTLPLLLLRSLLKASSSISFLALFSPSLPPDFSHVCSMGARARSTAGAALTPSDVCVRLWRSLINTGTGMAKLTSPTSSLALSQGFQALREREREKKKERKKAKTLLHPGVR